MFLALLVLPAPAATGLLALDPVVLELPSAIESPFEPKIAVVGPWRLTGVVDGVRSYEAPLPVRPRSLFFQSAPEGMALLRGSRKLRYGASTADHSRPATWSFSADGVTVRVAADVPRPGPGDYTLTWAQAHERQEALNVVAPETIVRSLQVGDTTRAGLYLPAPARIGWDLAVPDGASLRYSVGIIPAEVATGEETDGSWVDVEVGGRVIDTVRVPRAGFVAHATSVPAGATTRVGFHIRDADTEADRVFIAAPRLVAPTADPRRLLLVFIDTLRRDHLGTYGYDRAPAPAIDRLAASGVVFEDARSVAPWTLPSARSTLSGRQPEHWAASTSLPERLATEGWATGAYVGNVYLSSNFDMAGGWGEHGCVNWPSATLEVNRGVDFIERHPDEDALLMVHFMDMHLPYKEPYRYRDLYVREDIPGLGTSFVRSTLLRFAKGRQDEVRDYLIDRYDQNLRYIDDQVARLLRAAGANTTVLLFADHGEEFFDHGDLEHGHTLFDELLRVPLVLSSPGLAPHRVDAPVSLLDVTPTLLDLLGLPHEGLDGRSLLAAARGGALDPRPIGFGRPLYGPRAWGVATEGTKYLASAGTERRFDLRADPEETGEPTPSVDVQALRTAMAVGVGAPVQLGFRISASGTVRAPGVTLRVPGGIAQAWIGDDPTKKTKATLDRLDVDTIRATFAGTGTSQREIFVIPVADAQTIAGDVILTPGTDEPRALVPRLLGERPAPLAKARLQGKDVTVTWAVTPLPVGADTSGVDPEMLAALQAMGYVTDDREEAPEK